MASFSAVNFEQSGESKKKKTEATNVKSEISATVGWPFRRRRPMYFDTYFCFFSAFKDCSFFHLLKRINCVSRIYIKKTVPQLKPRDEKKAMAIGAHFTLN